MIKMKLRSLWAGMLLFGMAVSLLTATSVKAEEADVPINETTFPDSVFQKYIKNFDKNQDDKLSQDERNAVTEIIVKGESGEKITSIKGIEHFPELTTLECQENSLTDLDVSKNTKLQELNCEKNQLTSLDVRNNTELTKLNCRRNQLTSLDVTFNTRLQKLWFYGNQIASIDLKKNTELLDLTCGKNPLTSLDVSQNTKLTGLNCYNTQLASLDVSNKKNLTTLECFQNQLTSLDISGDTALEVLSCYENQLKSLDVSGSPALTQLSCGQNQLTELDLGQNTKLEKLYCANNQLTSLDVSNHTELTDLDCGSNKLTALKLGNNTKIDYLRCVYNRLTDLDVSANTALSALDTSHNPITSLDVSKNLNLGSLVCANNQLTSLDISANTKLFMLQCPSNQLTRLDISKNLKLSSLDCQDNQITGLDISKNPELDSLTFSNNPIMILKVTKAFSDRNLNAFITRVDVVQEDFGQCDGWDVSSISDITGGKLVGNVLEFDPMADEVTYTYDCGYNCVLKVYIYIRSNEYPVTYYLNGGTNASENPASYYPTVNAIILQAPAREGYVFEGWYEDEAFTTKITEIPKGHVGNVTVYAKWKEVPEPDPVGPSQPSSGGGGSSSTGGTTTGTGTNTTGSNDQKNATATAPDDQKNAGGTASDDQKNTGAADSNDQKNDGTTDSNDQKNTGTTDSSGQENAGAQSLPVGKRVTDKKSKAVYKVVESDSGHPGVEYVKPVSRKAATVVIPETITVDGVTYRVVSIARNAFKDNQKLKTLVIPKTVEKIGRRAVYDCQSLTRITIRTTKLTGRRIGSQAFTKAGSSNYRELTVQVPRSKKKAYASMLRKHGIHKKSEIK